MNNKTKIVLALRQIEGIAKLMKGNSRQQQINQNLASIHTELNRQLKLEKDKPDEN